MKFDRKVYDECDTPAKDVVSKYLTDKGWSCASPELYTHADVSAIKDNMLTFHEVEVKRVWTGDWPATWKTITIPYRKAKMFHVTPIPGNKRFRVHPPDLLTFWILSGDLKKAWTVRATKLRATEEKFCRYGKFQGMDKFFKVRLTSAKLITF